MAPSALDRIFESSGSQSKLRKGPTNGSDDGEIKELPGGYKKLPNGVVVDKDGKPYG